MLVHFLKLLFVFGTPEVSQELGTVVLYQYESVTFNLYEYFSGLYLNFSANSSTVELPEALVIKEVGMHPYSNINWERELQYTTYAVWSLENSSFLIDYYNSTIYSFSLLPSVQSLEPLWALDLNNTIQQILIWNSAFGTYAIAITSGDKNRVFIIDLVQTPAIPFLLSMWDLDYVSNLTSCNIDNTNIIPFSGSISGNGLMMIYEFSDPFSSTLIQTIYSYNTLYSFTTFRPIGIVQIASNNSEVIFGVLDSVYGIEFFKQSSGIFQPHSSIELSQYDCLNFISLVTSNYYHLTQNFTNVIMVGTCLGLAVVNFQQTSQMFFIRSYANNYSLSEVTGAVAISNAFFISVKDRGFIVVEDNLLSRDYLNYINLEDYIESYSDFGRWMIFPSIECYFYVRSDLNGIKVYNISYSSPTLSVNEAFTSSVIQVTATDYSNFIVSSLLHIKIIETINEIYFFNEYRESQYLNINLEVTFKGLSKSILFYANNYFSGRNSSFSIQPNISSDIFLITPGDYSKVQNDFSKILPTKYFKLVHTKSYLALLSSTGVDLYSKNLSSVLYSIILPSIENILAFDDILFISFLSNFQNIIYIYTQNSEYNVSCANSCNYLQSTGQYLICANQTFISIYQCLNIYCTFLSNFTSQSQGMDYIISVSAIWNNFVDYSNYLYILDQTGFIKLVSLDTLSEENNEPKLLGSIKIEGASSIMASSQQFYVVTKNATQIFTTDFQRLKLLPLDCPSVSQSMLNDFLFITTDKGCNYTSFCESSIGLDSQVLHLIDGLQTSFNSYYWENKLNKNCSFANAWFFNGITNFGLFCEDYNGNQILDIYSSRCPIEGNSSYPCTFPLPINVEITNSSLLWEGAYDVNIIVLAENSCISKSLDVNFNLIVYGLVVNYINNEVQIPSEISIDYNTGSQVNLHNYFKGNNMRISLMLNNISSTETLLPYSPMYLIDSYYLKANYNYSGILLSVSAVSGLPYLIASTNNGHILILNTSSSSSNNFSSSNYLNNPESMKIILTIHTSEYIASDSRCTFLQYVSTIENIFSFVTVCDYTQNTTQYWQAKENITTVNKVSTLLVIAVDFKSWTISGSPMWYEMPFKPKLLKVITGSSSNFSVIMVNYQIHLKAPLYNNNFLYRMGFFWDGSYIELVDVETLDYSYLNVENFFIVSVDGIYYETLYMVIADYWSGLNIFVVRDGISIKVTCLEVNSVDSIVSVGWSYKIIYAVSTNGMIYVYKAYNPMMPFFYFKIFPYTTKDSNITIMPSYISFSEFYETGYICFPILYTTNSSQYYHYRLININDDFSTFVTKDFPFANISEPNIDFYALSATFTDSGSLAFIVNGKQIVYYKIQDYSLVIPAMSNFYYKKMIENWKKPSFNISLHVSNDNSQLITRNIKLKIEKNSYSRSQNIETPIWIYVVIAISILIVLTIIVKIIYKVIFGERRMQRQTMNYSVLSINNFQIFSD